MRQLARKKTCASMRFNQETGSEAKVKVSKRAHRLKIDGRLRARGV
jgi:hypothetical protein